MLPFEGNALLWLLDATSVEFIATCLLNSIDDFAMEANMSATEGKARLEGKERK